MSAFGCAQGASSESSSISASAPSAQISSNGVVQASNEIPAESTDESADAGTAGESLFDLEYTDRDMDSSYDAKSATAIKLEKTTASVEGDGVAVDGSILTITEEGVYVISGTLDDGQIVVDAAEDAKVQLVFDGVQLTNESGAAVYVKQADKCFITLASGSVNSLAGGTSADTSEEDMPDAVLYAACDLTLQGSGSLSVTAYSGDAVKTKDDLVVTGGTYEIQAQGDGLVGKDSVKIADGSLAVKTTEGDGIKSSKDDDESKGFVSIDGGALEIDAADKGVKAQTFLHVGDGAVLNVKAGDDALHSNGSACVDGGNITLDSGDDGLHAEYTLDVNGGTLDITKCVEGLEGQVINVNDGEVTIVASDDAVNAASPEESSESTASAASEGEMAVESSSASAAKEMGDASGRGFPGGFGDMEKTDENCAVNINGGTMTIEAEGDGLDSNGYIYLNGGEVYISGPTNSGNGSLDFVLGAKVTGGTLIAAGTAGMAESFTEGTQGFALVSVSGAAGDKVVVSDSDGHELASFTPAKEFQCVVVTAPGMKDGETYAVSVNGKTTEFQATLEGGANLGMGGMGQGSWPEEDMGGKQREGFGGDHGPHGNERDSSKSSAEATQALSNGMKSRGMI